MTTTGTTSAVERWRSFFATTVSGSDELVEVATRAAVRALAAGGSRDDAVAAGLAAARRAVDEPPAKPRAGTTGGTAAGAVPLGAVRPVKVPASQARHTPTDRPGYPPTPSAAPPPAPAPVATTVWPAGSAVATLVERRSESLDGQFFQVLSCRLMALAGGTTPVGPAIAVEMRGRAILGQLVKGDVVVLPPGAPGELRLVKTLRNLTTASTIEAKGRPFRRMRTLRRTVGLALGIVVGVLALGFLAAVVGVGYALLNGQTLG